MKKNILRVLFYFVLVVVAKAVAATNVHLKSIDFKQKDEFSFLVLKFSGTDIDGKRVHLKEDKQIVLDVKNVTAENKILKDFDTSEFPGSIVYISSYKKPGSKNDIRITLQLRENVRSILEKDVGSLILKVENRFGALENNSKTTLRREGGSLEQNEFKKYNIPKSNSLEDILENLTLSGQKKYVGKKISLNIKGVAVEDVFRIISEVSGFNIIMNKEISALPPLSLNLVNTPWDEILDIVLRLNRLVAKKWGKILILQTLDSATAEAKKIAEAKKLQEKKEPLITKIFPISYADLTSLNTILAGYITTRGKISVDKRTNSLIIKDTSEAIERLKGIIETLDTQTPQVLIESKIVEITENHSQEFGLRNGLNLGYDPIGTASDPSVDHSSGLIGPQGSRAGEGVDGGPGFSFSSSPGAGGSILGLTIGKLGALFDLNFKLQLMESESTAKVISNPRIIAQNNTAASFTTSDEDYYAVRREGNAGDSTVTFDSQSATVSLNVTPQITNEGSILLKISVERGDFAERAFADGPRKKTSNNVKTSVLVDNGSTIILGGIYVQRDLLSTSGIPLLKDIPVIGWLFKSIYNPQSSKRELVMFMTPRIINQSRAGLK